MRASPRVSFVPSPRQLAIVFVTALIVGPACAARSTGSMQLPVEAFSGHVTRTSKGTWFTPCGESERWWVTYVDKSVKQAEEARREGLLAENQRTFVRWRASRTDERLVGPGGPALLVRDIFEIRAPAPGDCQRPTGEADLGRDAKGGEAWPGQQVIGLAE